MTRLARLLGFERPAPSDVSIEHQRALARARARGLVLSIAETPREPPGPRPSRH